MNSLKSRVESMLRHLVVGDALGKICSKYTKEEVYSLYGKPITGLVKPIRRNSNQEWFRGAVTDDTILTLLVADSLINRGSFDRRDLARRLIDCEPRGGKQIYKLKKSGNEDYVASDGETNGAAIRVSPLAVVETDLEELTTETISLSTLTHGSNEAITSALLVVYTLSLTLHEKQVSLETLDKNLLELYPESEKTVVRKNLRKAFSIAEREDIENLSDIMEDAVGFYKEAWSSIPTAIVLGLFSKENFREIQSIIHRNKPMGDLDSVASVAGSIMGAKRHNLEIEDISKEIEIMNSFSIKYYAHKLLGLRWRSSDDKVYCI